MSVFTEAIDDLFADPNIAQTVLYRAGGIGDGVPVRAITRRPDREVGFGDIAVHTETALFEVRVVEVANPAPGDSITIDGETFIVQGEPERDAERLIWTIDTRPA